MQRLGGICIALHMCGVFIPEAVDACADPRMAAIMRDDVQMRRAVIRFNVISVPAPGKAEKVEGRVDFVAGRSRWIPVKEGALLGDGAMLWLAPCTKLIIRFSGSESIEFQAGFVERWVVLRIDKGS